MVFLPKQLRGESNIFFSLIPLILYVVILADCISYLLLWSAYRVDRQHTKDSLLKEYEDYQKRLMPPG
jgi:multisubunit Na+/H+ antiporter MnhG subunit